MNTEKTGNTGNSAVQVTNRQSGRIGWALLWLLGIPLPVLLLLYLFGVGR